MPESKIAQRRHYVGVTLRERIVFPGRQSENVGGHARGNHDVLMLRDGCVSFLPVNTRPGLPGSLCRSLHHRPELSAASLGFDGVRGRLAGACAFGDTCTPPR